MKRGPTRDLVVGQASQDFLSDCVVGRIGTQTYVSGLMARKLSSVNENELLPTLARPLGVHQVGERLTYSIAETAELLGVHYHTVFRLLKRKKLRAIPSIRHKRIPWTEVQRFLSELE